MRVRKSSDKFPRPYICLTDNRYLLLHSHIAILLYHKAWTRCILRAFNSAVRKDTLSHCHTVQGGPPPIRVNLPSNFRKGSIIIVLADHRPPPLHFRFQQVLGAVSPAGHHVRALLDKDWTVHQEL